MTEDKIMAGGNLDNIVGRLIHCRAVLDMLIMAMGDDPFVDGVAGVGDLLDGISRDLQADIDGAEDYIKEAAE